MPLIPLLALSASATRLAMDASELCSFADAVVLAEVTSREIRWSAGPDGGIETHVWLAVSASVRGEAPETVEVVYRGGEADGITQWVEHAPDLREDHQYLLLLGRSEDAWSVIGGDADVWLVPDTNSRTTALASLGSCDAP